MMFTIPIATKSTANLREHHHVLAKRVSVERMTASYLARTHCRGATLPLVVVLTRVSPRELDTDNLSGALKGCRDGIADGLGLRDDRDPRVTWHVRQRKGKAAVEVIVRARLPIDDEYDRHHRAVAEVLA